MSEVMLATYGIAKDIHEAASGTASADELLQDVGANLFTIAVVEGLTAPKAGPSRVLPPARPAMMPNASNFSSPRNLNNAKPTRNACPPNAARRPSFRKATTERALEEAPVGPDGGKVCPTCEKPIGRGTIERGGRLRRDFDVDHTGKTWAQRVSEMRQNITRREVIEEYQRDVRAQCPDCNQSHAFEPKR
jgi:HNH/ENDO VII superfamily nuclease with conserved GHE residues